ncbi:MAG: hypothetical protein PVG11_01990 [Anaerolineae bacterium]|jgi:hypothetical protein
MITDIREKGRPVAAASHPASCEYRTVSPEGHIICKKIVEGDAEVSPNVCRECPFKAVDCRHLRFSLRHASPSPLIVRFNGREEVWNDGPPELRFAQAACAERVIPIYGSQACAECPLREPVFATQPQAPAAATPPRSARVVPFPGRDTVAAAAG